ncbi:MAG: hypothetical protein ACREEM_30275 [Blastocatellia bacterium]
MASNDSPRPNDANVELSIEKIWLLLPNAVRKAFWRYHHCFNQDEIKDLVQEIALSLLKGEGHAPRSFKDEASKKPWLRSVVNHHVQNSFRGRKNVVGLDAITPDDIACPLRRMKFA